MVTLDEAVKTANNAVLLATAAVAALKSVSYFRFGPYSFPVHDALDDLIISVKF